MTHHSVYIFVSSVSYFDSEFHPEYFVYRTTIYILGGPFKVVGKTKQKSHDNIQGVDVGVNKSEH